MVQKSCPKIYTDFQNHVAYEVISALHQADADESFLLLQPLSLYRRTGVLDFAIWERAGGAVLLPMCEACTPYIYTYDLLGVRFVFVFWNLFAVFESSPSNEQGQTQNFWLTCSME